LLTTDITSENEGISRLQRVGFENMQAIAAVQA
jgi:hypothetical protein